MRYSIGPKNRIIVKGNGFLFFPKNMGKNLGRTVNKFVWKKQAKNS